MAELHPVPEREPDRYDALARRLYVAAKVIAMAIDDGTGKHVTGDRAMELFASRVAAVLRKEAEDGK